MVTSLLHVVPLRLSHRPEKVSCCFVNIRTKLCVFNEKIKEIIRVSIIPSPLLGKTIRNNCSSSDLEISVSNAGLSVPLNFSIFSIFIWFCRKHLVFSFSCCTCSFFSWNFIPDCLSFIVPLQMKPTCMHIIAYAMKITDCIKALNFLKYHVHCGSCGIVHHNMLDVLILLKLIGVSFYCNEIIVQFSFEYIKFNILYFYHC